MSTLSVRPPSVKPSPIACVTANGVSYEVLPLDAGEEGRLAFHLQKINGQPVDAVVILDIGSKALCSCRLGWEQHECAHLAALRTAGLLSANEPANAPRRIVFDADPEVQADMARHAGSKVPEQFPWKLHVEDATYGVRRLTNLELPPEPGAYGFFLRQLSPTWPERTEAVTLLPAGQVRCSCNDFKATRTECRHITGLRRQGLLHPAHKPAAGRSYRSTADAARNGALVGCPAEHLEDAATYFGQY